jgi:hypothetical protein
MYDQFPPALVTRASRVPTHLTDRAGGDFRGVKARAMVGRRAMVMMLFGTNPRMHS